MTSISNIQFYNFNDSKKGSGIDNNALIKLSKHNIRKEIDYQQERWQSKKSQEHISLDLSRNNICYKQLDYSKDKELKKQKKDTKAKANTVGAFSLLFDFDIPADGFDSHSHKALIMEFLESVGILERFEVLEMVLHLDEDDNGTKEPKPHFHILFSGFDKLKGKFAVNDFFSPHEGVAKDENGNTIYKKIPNGANRGELQKDQGGNFIARPGVRRNGASWYQKKFAEFLEPYVYENKKQFSSSLQFPNKIWQNFTNETKESVYYFRRLENLYHEEKAQGLSADELLKIEQEMANGVLEILGVAREIEQDIREQQRTKTKTKGMTR